MKIKLTALLSTFFVSFASFAQLQVEHIKVDTTITGFHFAANFQGTYVYTPNGKTDLNTVNPSAFSFTLMPHASYKEGVEQINQLLNMSTDNGYSHADVVKKDTTINGYKAYYTTLTETQKGTDYTNYIFHAFYIKDDTVVLFVSGDLDHGKYIENFKKTFYSVQL